MRGLSSSPPDLSINSGRPFRERTACGCRLCNLPEGGGGWLCWSSLNRVIPWEPSWFQPRGERFGSSLSLPALAGLAFQTRASWASCLVDGRTDLQSLCQPDNLSRLGIAVFWDLWSWKAGKGGSPTALLSICIRLLVRWAPPVQGRSSLFLVGKLVLKLEKQGTG